MYFSLNEHGMWWLKDTDEEFDHVMPPKNVSVVPVCYSKRRGYGVQIWVEGKKIPNVSIGDSLIIETSKKFVISIDSLSSDLSKVFIITDDQESWSECVSLAPGSQYSEACVFRLIILYLIKKKKIKI